jgi:predicted transcriptional regulator
MPKVSVKSAVLMSIKPKFADRIMNGEKKWEFRKVWSVTSPDRIYVYSSSPVQLIIGYFIPGQILYSDPKELWKRCQPAGIEKKEFFEYFKKFDENNKGKNLKQKNLAKAIEISEFFKFKTPVTLNQLSDKLRPPQNYFILCIDKINGFQNRDFNVICANCGNQYILTCGKCPECRSDLCLISNTNQINLIHIKQKGLEMFL